MILSVIGMPLKKAAELFDKHGMTYTVSRTSPTRDFFKTDESKIRVIRARQNEDGSFCLTVASEQQSTI